MTAICKQRIVDNSRASSTDASTNRFGSDRLDARQTVNRVKKIQARVILNVCAHHHQLGGSLSAGIGPKPHTSQCEQEEVQNYSVIEGTLAPDSVLSVGIT